MKMSETPRFLNSEYMLAYKLADLFSEIQVPKISFIPSMFMLNIEYTYLLTILLSLRELNIVLSKKTTG